MIAGIVLAAGEGKRIKKDKLLLPLGSRLVIDWVLFSTANSLLTKIILVTKPDENGIVEIGKKYNVNIIFNPEYKEGMSTTIKKGLLAIKDDKKINGFCIILGDQPFINPYIINQLIRAFHKGQKEIIVPFFRGINGNPVLFDVAWIEEFMKISGDIGGRDIIKDNPKKVRKIEISDDAILVDIDKEEDYIKAKTYLKFRKNWGNMNEI